MDRVLAARPLVGHVLVACFREDVEQAYRAPEGCWWRGGSILQSCCCWFLGGCEGLYSVRSTTSGCLAVIPMEWIRIKLERASVLARMGWPEVQAERKVQMCKQSTVWVYFFFFRPFVVGKSLLIRPFETRLFLYWPASRCANGARFFTWFAGSTGRAQCLTEM